MKGLEEGWSTEDSKEKSIDSAHHPSTKRQTDKATNSVHPVNDVVDRDESISSTHSG